jgi:hypothetical protein
VKDVRRWSAVNCDFQMVREDRHGLDQLFH